MRVADELRFTPERSAPPTAWCRDAVFQEETTALARRLGASPRAARRRMREAPCALLETRPPAFKGR